MCVDHGFKILFVGGGEYVVVGPKADQLAASRTFIQIKGEAPRWVVVSLEGGASYGPESRRMSSSCRK